MGLHSSIIKQFRLIGIEIILILASMYLQLYIS
jgi:hypothetical protein